MNENIKPDIILVGLGPGDLSLLTQQATQLLQNISELHLRTRLHPVVSSLPPALEIHSFDDIYERAETFEEVYATIVDQILALAIRPEGVVYAVPGHPFVAEATSPEILRRATAAGLSVQVVHGLSFLEPVFSTLGLDPYPNTSLIDALELSVAHYPPYPPDRSAIVAQIYSPEIASEVKLTLMAVYPDDHQVKLVHEAGTAQCSVEDLPLYKIDRSAQIGLFTCLYVPALGPATSFEAFQEIIAHLRAPDGCPWDREQTHLSLRPFLMEETFEALAALDAEDSDALQEELGDLLIQVVLHAQIASEEGEFRMQDVLRHVHQKLVHRHPHVFGDVKVKDAADVKFVWDRLKAAERAAGRGQNLGILDGVALALPALAQADAYQKRAARVGFDWPKLIGVIEKVHEELEEVRTAPDSPSQAAEIGDLLFTVVNLARWYEVDAESVLREANVRFRTRFEQLEKIVRQTGRKLVELSPEEMNEIWEKVK